MPLTLESVLTVTSRGKRGGKDVLYVTPKAGVDWNTVILSVLSLSGTEAVKEIAYDGLLDTTRTSWRFSFPEGQWEKTSAPGARGLSSAIELRPFTAPEQREIPPEVRGWFRVLAIEEGERGAILVGHPRQAAKWPEIAKALLKSSRATEIAKVVLRRGTSLVYVWRVVLGTAQPAQNTPAANPNEEIPFPGAPTPLIQRAPAVVVRDLPTALKVPQRDGRSVSQTEFNRRLQVWQMQHAPVLAEDKAQAEVTARELVGYRERLASLKLGADGKLASVRDGDNRVTRIPIMDPRPAALGRVIIGGVGERGASGWSPPQGDGVLLDIQPHDLDRKER